MICPPYHVHNKHTSLTTVFWKADIEGRSLDLLLKQILLVQEEYDGRVSEPLAVACRVEQTKAFLHSILYTHIWGGLVAEWLACWTHAQNGLGSNRLMANTGVYCIKFTSWQTLKQLSSNCLRNNVTFCVK